MSEIKALSGMGRFIHFSFAFAKTLKNLSLVLVAILILSTILIVFFPQFSLHKEGFVISPDPKMAIAQVLVGGSFLVSLVVCGILAILGVLWIYLEIILELRLKKKVINIIRAQRTVHLSSLAHGVGLHEDDLGILIKNWAGARGKFQMDPASGTISGNHLHFDTQAKEITWVE